MNKPPSFQFYAQDFLTGVVYLTNEEIGIYIKMLCKQWTDEKIPKKRLGFLVGYDWVNLSEELKSKFDDRGDYVINTRLEEERQRKQKFLKKQSINGKQGGRPKKKKDLEKPNKSQKKPLEDEVEIEDEYDLDNENILKKSEKTFTEVWPTFEDFWDCYEKKVGKRDKIKSKFNALSQKTKEAIMAYIPDYKISQPDKAFRKNPETFLNNESWKDEIIIKNGKSNSSAQGPSAEFRKKTAERLGVI